jgi:hypothetical protein
MRLVAAIFALAAAWPVSPALAQEAAAKFDPAVRPEFNEPVTLASKDGVLEVRLIAKQGENGFRQPLRRPQGHHGGSRPGDFGKGAAIRNERGRAARHSLQRRQTKTLI